MTKQHEGEKLSRSKALQLREQFGRDVSQVQLPLWPEPVRGAPNALLRSALFAAIRSEDRKDFEGERPSITAPPLGVVMAAQGESVLRYRGTQLNQYDADVFFEALHRARQHPMETECFFNGHEFLKAIGKRTGPEQYEDLYNSLMRLRDNNLKVLWSVKGQRFEFNGSLIATFEREKESKLYKLTFSKRILGLFAPACWTQLEWEQRLALKGKQLVSWLHSYFSTHAQPYPVSVSYLRDMCGSAAVELYHFKAELKKGLRLLEELFGWKALWDGDTVTVLRSPSESQLRHLQYKAEKKKAKKAEQQRAKVQAQGGFSTPRDILPSLGDLFKRR